MAHPYRRRGGTTIGFGQSRDVPDPFSYGIDGNKTVEPAVYRQEMTAPTYQWRIKVPWSYFARVVEFGTTYDRPLVGDFSQDGLDDLVLYNATSGEWTIEDHPYLSPASPFDTFTFGAIVPDRKTAPPGWTNVPLSSGVSSWQSARTKTSGVLVAPVLLRFSWTEGRAPRWLQPRPSARVCARAPVRPSERPCARVCARAPVDAARGFLAGFSDRGCAGCCRPRPGHGLRNAEIRRWAVRARCQCGSTVRTLSIFGTTFASLICMWRQTATRNHLFPLESP